jgi:putative copper export protein
MSPSELGELAPDTFLRDHPTVQILLPLASALIAMLYLVAIALLVGTTAFHFLVWRRTSLPVGPVRSAAEEQMFSLVTTVGIWSSIALLVLVGPRAAGVASLLDDRYTLRSRVDALVLHSEWGIGFAAMACAGVLSFVGYVAIRRRNSAGWPFVLLAIPCIAVGAGLQGHPYDAFSKLSLAPLFDGLHAVGTGAWLGSFLMLVLAERRLPPHTASPWTDPLGGMLERYFRASGALVTVVLITGLFSSSTHLTGFDDISGSLYGHLLAGKVGIVIILMSFHEMHRRHAERQARTSERARLAHTMRFQAGLIGLVLALTVLLIDATPPGVNEVRGEVFRSSPRGSIQSEDVEIER